MFLPWELRTAYFVVTNTIFRIIALWTLLKNTWIWIRTYSAHNLFLRIYIHAAGITADAPYTAISGVFAWLLDQSPPRQNLLAPLNGTLLLPIGQLRSAATATLETDQWPNLVTQTRPAPSPLGDTRPDLRVWHTTASALFLEALSVVCWGSYCRLLLSRYRRLGIYFLFKLTEIKRPIKNLKNPKRLHQ